MYIVQTLGNCMCSIRLSWFFRN